ncbi:OmpA family protein [uncultured Croceitalea sp.]|uniref:OmpA family protein n=1 Tax=uncultured Croceitalea sp. TaxID=1798908 RepID=UPI00374F7649
MRCVLYYVLGVLYFASYYVTGQNLVKNPSFEDYYECPNTLGTFGEHVKSWSAPTAGTTDYFNTCSAVMSAPENFNGVQQTKDGQAYAGLYFYAPGDYREYIQVELKQKLRANKKYHLSFYISLAEGSDFAVKDFGVVCSYKPIAAKTKKELSKGRLYAEKGNKFHSFEINHPKFHEDKSDWLAVTTSFTAKGYEQYLILGNLRDNKFTRKVQTKRKESKKGAYYYIDMVSLVLEDTSTLKEFELETVHRFENVLFDFDVFLLGTEGKETMLRLFNYLKTNPGINIKIIGHTDSQGPTHYNKNLSIKRAKSISDYLVELGLDKERVSFTGHGSSKPISNNETETGRRENRRVEFILAKTNF